MEQVTVWVTDEIEQLPLLEPVLLEPIVVNGNSGIDPTDPAMNP